jgi:large subunit ribosomal protein L23
MKNHSKISSDQVILRPHVTEKSTIGVERGVYTFQVDNRATKEEVARAVKEVFGVQALKVNIVNRPTRRRVRRGRTSSKMGYRKALVYLKEGDKIEFV